MIAAAGIVVTLLAVLCQVIQLVVSIRRRDELRDETGDPWDGRSLEWATASPPPAFNFAVLPNVHGEEPYWEIKQRAIETQHLSAEPEYEPIEMPAQQPDRIRHRLLRHADRLCADLAHLVAGRRRSLRGLRGLRRGSPGATRWRTKSRPRRSRASTGRGARPAPAGSSGRFARVSRHEHGHLPRAAAARRRSLLRSGRAFDGAGRGGRGRSLATGHGEGGPASKRVIVGYGFWIFLLSDIVMFSCFFAAYAVLQTATADGPSGREFFDPMRVAMETGLLLTSSFTCGLSAVATEARSQLWTQVVLLVTGLLGVGFLMLEVQEFASLIAAGAGPQRSAFLSAFFTVVGCHGLHVSVGLLWLGTMMAQVFVKGFRPDDHAPAALLQPVLARARHHLGRAVHHRLPDRTRPMSENDTLCRRRRPRLHGCGRSQRREKASAAMCSASSSRSR